MRNEEVRSCRSSGVAEWGGKIFRLEPNSWLKSSRFIFDRTGKPGRFGYLEKILIHLGDTIPRVFGDDPPPHLVTKLFPEVRTLVQMHDGAGDFRVVLVQIKKQVFPVWFD
jgi:hypothetical protein